MLAEHPDVLAKVTLPCMRINHAAVIALLRSLMGTFKRDVAEVALIAEVLGRIGWVHMIWI